MLKAYDLAVKELIKVFAPNINVIGLQNDDTTDEGEASVTKAGLNAKEDKISYPIISVFRNPGIEIADGSITKRASTSEGYSSLSQDGERVLSLVAMRSTLTYTIDIFDVTREAAEKIAIGLYFRLRNNPEISATFEFEDFNKSVTCKAEIELKSDITNVRVNDSGKSQLYKIRFSFNLVNANIYDIIDREAIKYIEYSIRVSLKERPETSIKLDIQ